jgi:hypothetical protein
MWRNLLSGGLDRREERLEKGLRALHSRRDGSGRWGQFPFWYTVLALEEAGTAAARKEIAYAAPLLVRAAERKPGEGASSRRRHGLAVRALARI